MAKVTSLSFVVPVRDLDVAADFYREAFGLEEVFRADEILFVGLPSTDIAIGLFLDPANAGSGPQTVGFHIDHAVPPAEIVQDVERAGGRLVERGEHAPGVPFARIADPDGNVLWT